MSLYHGPEIARPSRLVCGVGGGGGDTFPTSKVRDKSVQVGETAHNQLGILDLGQEDQSHVFEN